MKEIPYLLFMKRMDAAVIGKGLEARSTGVELIGQELRAYMSAMKPSY